MVLAVDSYRRVRTLSDDGELLNLAWTLDERPLLDADLMTIAARELEDELRSGFPYLGRYCVDDPYGEGLIGPAVCVHFGLDGRTVSITCGAGVNSLLHAFTGLVRGGRVAVRGEVYPDFPHWVAVSGGSCDEDLERASVILVDRPALTGDDGALDELSAWCVRGAVVIVDESYGNYETPEWSAVRLAARLPNLVVLRGFSKAYSQGGLRLAYCVTARETAERVRAVVPPMLASSLSLRIGAAILREGDVATRLRARVVEARAEMLACLRDAGISGARPAGGHVPFVFLRDGSEDVRIIEDAAILGKRQPFWSAADKAVIHRYRLSVPLAHDRMEQFKRNLGKGQ